MWSDWQLADADPSVLKDDDATRADIVGDPIDVRQEHLKQGPWPPVGPPEQDE